MCRVVPGAALSPPALRRNRPWCKGAPAVPKRYKKAGMGIAMVGSNPETTLLTLLLLATLPACSSGQSSNLVGELEVQLVEVQSADVPDRISSGAPAEAQLQLWYLDLDEDGFGDGGKAWVGELGQHGYVADAGDCNDEDPNVRPGELDDCDGIDTNCDGVVDEGGIRWLDRDGDGFGGMPVATCALTPGLSEWPGDCDDRDAEMSPGQPEVCNGRDENCDMQIDDRADCGCDARSLSDGGSLLVCDAPAPWQQAAEFCAARGYHLATIFNGPDNMLFRSIAATHDHGDWWVGLYEVEGAWHWVDQTAVVYTDWMNLQPEVEEGARCGSLSADPRAVGSWRVTPCDQPRSFLCIAD